MATGSGDAPTYAHTREFEDVAAVVADLGDSDDVYSHLGETLLGF